MSLSRGHVFPGERARQASSPRALRPSAGTAGPSPGCTSKPPSKRRRTRFGCRSTPLIGRSAYQRSPLWLRRFYGFLTPPTIQPNAPLTVRLRRRGSMAAPVIPIGVIPIGVISVEEAGDGLFLGQHARYIQGLNFPA